MCLNIIDFLICIDLDNLFKFYISKRSNQVTKGYMLDISSYPTKKSLNYIKVF